MTTVARKNTLYPLIGKIAAGGVTTQDQGGAPVEDDCGAYQLQDSAGGTFYVSAEDFAANWQIVTP